MCDIWVSLGCRVSVARLVFLSACILASKLLQGCCGDICAMIHMRQLMCQRCVVDGCVCNSNSTCGCLVCCVGCFHCVSCGLGLGVSCVLLLRIGVLRVWHISVLTHGSYGSTCDGMIVIGVHAALHGKGKIGEGRGA